MPVFRDILLGLMKRLIKMRSSNLKVLITSATLDGEKVSRFFSNCPILNVPGKLFPVEIRYSSERPTSYLESSLKTAIGMFSNSVSVCVGFLMFAFGSLVLLARNILVCFCIAWLGTWALVL